MERRNRRSSKMIQEYVMNPFERIISDIKALELVLEMAPARFEKSEFQRGLKMIEEGLEICFTGDK